nr:16S rRNA (cytidine(1402)-2'-O)-methyltransferase [uncultured Desulfuromonas sp.]
MSETSGCGVLYVVATPIGNLEDITFRAIRVLKEVALIAAEDTRHSRRLCTHFGIDTPLTSCFEHNEARKGDYLIERLQRGDNIALISDAGTPAISDPGSLLVQRCCEAGIVVHPVPGASACVAALSMAGLPTDRFCFEGFLPPRQQARRQALQHFTDEGRTTVFYEAPHRLISCLQDLVEVLGEERQVVVVRELTKLHEERIAGTASEVLEHFSQGKVRGEIVVLLAPAEAQPIEESVEESLLRALRDADKPMKAVAKQVAKLHGVSGSDVYALAVQLKDQGLLNDQ